MSRARRAVAPVLIGIVGVVVLIALGSWQVQRLHWKEALIAEIEARLAADPAPMPASPDPGRDRLLRVTAAGRIGTEELHVLSSVRPWGAGYRVIAPMTLTDGRRVMVDLGFVPEAMKDPAARPQQLRRHPDRPADVVTGVLSWPAESDGWTPEPDPARNIWFAREVAAMARALDSDPVLLVAEEHGLGELPHPVPPGTDVPNRHLEYAITWYGLAVVWLVMAIIWTRAELRGRVRTGRPD